MHVGDARFLVKGVAYGTFAPGPDGEQFPEPDRVASDFAMMSRTGINTVRTYTAPPRRLLDEALRHGLRVIADVPWTQHVAFLDDRKLHREARRHVLARVRALADHPALLLLMLGNEIPPPVVRWHGCRRVERFLRSLYEDAKSAAPDVLFAYGNYPPTEYLELPFFDVCAFNVYLHREAELRGYLARLQHIAGPKPLLLAETGADSLRQNEEGQATLVAMQLRAVFEEGACGAVVFAWTDEWWRGGSAIRDWAFGLVDSSRTPKLAAHAASRVFASVPFRAEQRRSWPKVSVVVCAYNAADTIDECLSSLEQLTYPDVELILVDDGSHDATGAIASRHSRVRVIRVPNGGLSAARNVGLTHATGEIIAYTDADARVDPQWLTYLVQPFMTSDVVAAGGPNVVPPDDPWRAQCVARAPGAPMYVMLDDRIAEHIPGCNMAIRREALAAVGGFDPRFLRAGDDVDLCWRLQARGWKIGFSPAALVWHRHRATIRAYWRQQVGYGEGETWLHACHPNKFARGRAIWHGCIYSPLPFVRSLTETRIHTGVWGTAAFPSVYRATTNTFAYLPHLARWQVASLALLGLGVAMLLSIDAPGFGAILLAAGLSGLGTTLYGCLRNALSTDIDGLPHMVMRSRAVSRAIYRATIAALHFIQPLARLHGRLRGLLSPARQTPQVAAPQSSTPSLSFTDSWRSVQLVAGIPTKQRFWSESWVSSQTLLTNIAQRLRTSRLTGLIQMDDGWETRRDVSIAVGAWAWLDLRTLIEEHGGGKCLVRFATRLRPTMIGALATGAVFTLLLLSRGVSDTLFGVPMSLGVGAVAVGLLARSARTVARMFAVLRGAIEGAADELMLQPIESASSRQTLGQLLRPSRGARRLEKATIEFVGPLRDGERSRPPVVSAAEDRKPGGAPGRPQIGALVIPPERAGDGPSRRVSRDRV